MVRWWWGVVGLHVEGGMMWRGVVDRCMMAVVAMVNLMTMVAMVTVVTVVAKVPNCPGGQKGKLLEGEISYIK